MTSSGRLQLQTRSFILAHHPVQKDKASSADLHLIDHLHLCQQYESKNVIKLFRFHKMMITMPLNFRKYVLEQRMGRGSLEL